MNILQIGLFVFAITSVLGLIYAAFAGPSAAKESARRLQSVRYRHSESTVDKVESQLKKAIAARKPKMHHIAGSESRITALALRLLARDWRAGELTLVAVAVVVAVASVTTVGFFADRVHQALSRQANQLLGADLVIYAKIHSPNSYRHFAS